MGLEGDSVIEARGAVTVTCVEVLIVPTEAVIVVVPTASELTMPALPAALLIVATLGEDEFQMTD